MLKDRRNASIATIKIHQKDLGLNDDQYRDVLQDVTGKRSSTELSEVERIKVLAHFDKLAVALKVTLSKPKAKPTGIKRTAAAGKAGLMEKLNAQLLDMELTRAYLENAAPGRVPMVRQIAGVDSLEFATPEGLRKLVAALAIQQRRAA